MMDAVGRLLSRGGRILGLAAVAHAREGASALGSWRVLAPETGAAADEILEVLADPVPDDALAIAIGAAMSQAAATAPPRWAEPLWQDPTALDRIGELARAIVVPRIVADGATPRLVGLGALAMAVCRSADQPAALASKLPARDGVLLARMARLAGCIAVPGEPSGMRALIREALEVARG